MNSLRRISFGTVVVKMNSTYRCPKLTAFTKMHTLSQTQSNILITCLAVLAPITITANSLLAFALVKTKQVTKPTSHVFIFLLCMSDIFVGAVTIPFDIIIFAKYRRVRICTLELVGNFIGQLFPHLSVNIILIIALHRYIQINPSLREITGLKKWLISKTGSVILVVLAFLSAVANGLIASYLFGSYYNRVPNWLIKAIDCVLFIVIYGLYVNLFWNVKKHTRANKVLWNAENQAVKTNSGASGINPRPTYFKKFTKTVILILIAIVLCYLPYVTIDISQGLLEQSLSQSSAQLVRFFYYMTWMFLFSNSTINAAIIIYRNDKLKAFIKEKIFRYF